ncbi:MAG: thioredoxin-disulfide reductase [Nitrospirae bacterium]|nr:thioredoxin-disulfide reductase [Nitrospirota bacterium]
MQEPDCVIMDRKMKPKENTFISEDSKKHLKKELALLTDPVTIIAVLSDEQNKPFNEFSRKLLTELAALSEKIRPVFEKPGSVVAGQYGVTRTPTLLVQPERYHIRYTGAPAGEEAQTFLLALIMASSGQSVLSEASKKRLSELHENRNIKVFVSPTCPYCPLQVLLAVSAAIANSSRVSAEIIEIYENKDLAEEYNSFTVPQVFVDDRIVGRGLQPEEVFIEEVLTAAPVKLKAFEGTEGIIEKDLVIAGAGPAGLTAAIYAERSGIKTVVIEKGNIGGQVAITPVVENYPGFTRIGGSTLMDMMAQQTIQYADIHQGEEVLEARKKGDFFELRTNRAAYRARAVLLATGAESRKAGLPGETEFAGRGVSYCASCDGYYFKDGKKVLVIGGGNTAATEALYLKNIGVDVTIVHRRDSLRAEQYLRDRLAANNIPILLNSTVKEIQGDKSVRAVAIENAADHSVSTMPVDGIFIAIGYVPNNQLAKKLGVDLDAEGYIKIDKGHRTNVKGVYAAGDITGGFKQIVTAVGQGSIAAESVFEDISAGDRKID